ncbi:MAG: hypothetical protein R3E01_07980 [Pirellulaceae bacterium]|nr:hypothetical protein [Planctomycetales bacterium]
MSSAFEDYELTWQFLDDQRVSDALQQIDMAIKKAGEMAELACHMTVKGGILQRCGRYPEAISVLREALSVRPKNWIALT